ncbi:TerB family tellurite resistance protein [Hyphomicrobium sp. NDB2Meth4]|uniref:TerB family tellurite resistance protein n=1 Tax=Hyphomicrobium sp. NDB2Meth4 TaxID=1892846 RepID=UPI000B235396|nr:TerB family tellurite resistance protein [Hyphomicrobium sp. NDB2Meth4]
MLADQPSPSATLSPQEALIYAMVAAAAADRTIAQIEIERMHSMVRELPAFRGLDDAWFGREAQACGKLLSRPDGVNKVVRLIGEALIGELRETAYALAAEVAASDLALQADEKSFLDLLGDGLRLDELTRAALQRTARVRHRST